MSRGIKRKVREASKRVQRDMSDSVDRDSLFSRGLSSEGYLGGYRDALHDIMLALDGVNPKRRGWWDGLVDR